MSSLPIIELKDFAIVLTIPVVLYPFSITPPRVQLQEHDSLEAIHHCMAIFRTTQQEFAILWGLVLNRC